MTEMDIYLKSLILNVTLACYPISNNPWSTSSNEQLQTLSEAKPISQGLYTRQMCEELTARQPNNNNLLSSTTPWSKTVDLWRYVLRVHMFGETDHFKWLTIGFRHSASTYCYTSRSLFKKTHILRQRSTRKSVLKRRKAAASEVFLYLYLNKEEWKWEELRISLLKIWYTEKTTYSPREHISGPVTNNNSNSNQRGVGLIPKPSKWFVFWSSADCKRLEK